MNRIQWLTLNATIDTVLRPNHKATKLALRHQRRYTSEDGDSSSNEDDIVIVDTEQKAATSPEIQSSTRSGRRVGVANYDMKHHPMDTVLRPRAAAKRIRKHQLGVGQKEKTMKDSMKGSMKGRSLERKGEYRLILLFGLISTTEYQACNSADHTHQSRVKPRRKELGFNRTASRPQCRVW